MTCPGKRAPVTAAIHWVAAMWRKLDRFSPFPSRYPFVLSENEKTFFDRAVRVSRNYLEFGSGGSTLRALQKSKAKIYSVECDPCWLARMRRYLIFRFFEEKRLFVTMVDIGPVGKWGYPQVDADKNLFPFYSSAIFDRLSSEKIDLVFIDGRFRVACCLMSILKFHKNSNLRILIHDFCNRPEYHTVLKYLDMDDCADNLALFSIKKGIDLQLVNNDYDSYKFDPR
jgi:hypothetical protein